MIEKMKKLSIILLILFLLFIPITSSAQYSGRSLSEIKIIMNGALEIVGIKAKIIRVIRNLNTEKVDFYAQITTQTMSGEQEFIMTLGGVISVVATVTRQTSWASDKLYFCHLKTNASIFWYSTKDCRRLLKLAEAGASESKLNSEIMEAMHYL